MPSLSKDSAGRSPFWICNYTAATGQRLKKSTKQTDSAKAWEVCLALVRAEKLAKEGEMTEQAAKKLIGEVLERATGKGLSTHKAGAWLDEWLASKKDSWTPKTRDKYFQVVRDFKVSLGERSKLSLGGITAADVLAYRKSVTAMGRSNGTANDAVKVVSVAFNAAFRLHFVAANPCTAIESLEEDTAPRDAFTAVQVAALIAAAETDDWKRAIVFTYFTGPRLGDVANMRWNQIDLSTGVIRFKPKKTKRKKIEVVIPIHPHLLKILLVSPGVGVAFVFPSLAGKQTGGVNGLSAQFAKIMEKAGIVATITRHTPKGRRNKSLSFHSLRHSFNSELANAGVQQEVRMKLTGHTKKETNTIYTHHELAVLKAAVEKMPGLA